MKYPVELDGKTIEITNPDKILWPKYQVKKIDYIKYLLDVAETILPYLRNRLLTTIRYPDGVEGKFFYQKNIPEYTPPWISSATYEETEYIVANDRSTLVYLGNQACLEFHPSFHLKENDQPTELVFDLDPSIHDFGKVIEAALAIKVELDQLQLPGYVKTSGASGLQIYIPIKAGHSFEETRAVGSFFATYMVEKHPRLFTIERMVKNRGNKIYFDYLQHWRGKTLIAPYSTRAKEAPYVSTPLLWSEVPTSSPHDFTIFNLPDRIKAKGDLFQPLLSSQRIDLKPLLNLISKSHY